MRTAARDRPAGVDLGAFCDRMVAISATIRKALEAEAGAQPERKDGSSSALRFRDVRFDLDRVRSGLQEVAEAAQDCGLLPPGEPDQLPTVAAERESLVELLRSWFDGEPGFRSWCQESSLDENLVTLACEVAAKPFVAAAAGALGPDGAQAREPGSCPACAGVPDFAYLGTEAGERNLVCSRCETGWRFQRIGCPFCGTTDAASLTYAQTDDRAFRVYLCGECRRYLKTVDQRSAGSSTPLYEHRLRTWTLDQIAIEGGYRSR